MVLIDSSIWVDFFRKGDSSIKSSLLREKSRVVTHEMIIGEMMLSNRTDDSFLEELLLISRLPSVSFEEYWRFVKEKRIAGKGIGYVDTNLLASSIKNGARIWTLDKKLAQAAEESGCLYVVGEAGKSL